MFNSIISGAVIGLESHLIHVEVDISPGLPCFQMVGYLSNEVRESKDRVKVALKNSGFSIPAMCINVNLSPANIRKEGTAYDLPLAIGVLTSLGEIDSDCLSRTLIIGELGLDGEVRPVRGILPIVRAAKEYGIAQVILPKDNSNEASVVPEISVIPISTLTEAYMYLTGEISLQDIYNVSNTSDPNSTYKRTDNNYVEPDFADIRGQFGIKRAAEVAAAGFHHLLMIGPPGAGKTMIAKRIPGILPPLTIDESLEVTSIYSIAGLLESDNPLITQRPFLSPHHTITEHALAGGGNIPRPGVISLAHRGVLFLDEMTEFNRSTLDIMRQPLEDKCVYISRSHGTYKYPSDFMLVAACNPCPCGYYPNLNKCTCTQPQVNRYLNKISGPLLDRIDICCDVEPVDFTKLTSSDTTPRVSSADIRNRVMLARERQEFRFRDSSIQFNSEISGGMTDTFCPLSSSEKKLMDNAYDSLGLSARSYHRILTTARTIADLADSDTIKEEHLSEAILYRTSGSRYWGR